MSYAADKGNFTIAMAGDTMLTRRLSIFDEPEFLALRRIYQEADAGFVNLESVVRNPDEGTPGITRGTYMTTPPELLAEFKWYGINLVGTANNHAFDYGEQGCLATIAHLRAAGIAYAGSGNNLAEARRPGYLDTKGGRVALIATTATYRPWNAAGDQRPDMRGRPGINPFGSSTSYTVDKATFDALQRMSRELGFDQTRQRNRTHFYSDSEAPPDQADALDLFGKTVERGSGFTARSEGKADDVADHLRWIKEARAQADWVVVSLHSHEFSQRSLIEAKTRIDLKDPADFIPVFAKAAIDAGADMFVGHGSHTPLGIEIYKGKPIIYSLGNFIFQNETVTAFPAEAYGRFGLSYEATPADFLDARTGGGTKGHVAHAGFWENMVVTCHHRSGKLAEVRIHPTDLGFGKPRGQRGRPMLAGREVAERVIARVGDMSRRYGVEVRNQNGVGVITV